MQLEAARSPLDVMRRAQTAQGAAALADRGLVGSGAGREYLEGLEERLAPQYTQAAQQIAEQRRQAEDQRYSQALGLGAQRAGQIENLRQQGLQSAIGEAGRQTAQQEQLQQQILQSFLVFDILYFYFYFFGNSNLYEVQLQKHLTVLQS